MTLVKIKINLIQTVTRVVWDDENPDWDFKSRTLTESLATPNPPAVNRFYPIIKEDAGDFRVNMERPYDWKQAIIDLNGGGLEGYRRWAYLTGDARATYNTTGWPMQAYLVFSGNELEGERVGEWFRFETLKPSDLTRVGGWTIQTHPHLIHRFTCVGWDQSTQTTKHIESTGTPRGQVYSYVVTKEGYGYIPWRHIVTEQRSG